MQWFTCSTLRTLSLLCHKCWVQKVHARNLVDSTPLTGAKTTFFRTEIGLLALKLRLTLPNEVDSANVWWMFGLRSAARIPFSEVRLEGWITSWNNWAPKSHRFIMPVGFTVCDKSINARCATDVASVRARLISGEQNAKNWGDWWWSGQISPKWTKLLNN